MSLLADSAAQALDRALRSGVHGLWLTTPDEPAWLDVLEQIGDELQWPVHTWSPVDGVDHDGHPIALVSLLAQLRQDHALSLWVILDGASLGSDPVCTRALRELAQRNHGPVVVVLSPVPPMDVRAGLAQELPEITHIQPGPPSSDRLAECLHDLAAVLKDHGHNDAHMILSEHEHALVRAASGLSEHAFERAFAAAIVDHGLDPLAIERTLRRAKTASLPLLEPVDPTPIEDLGGLDQFKRWLERRALALQPNARVAGISSPRGVLLIGVQGCGKSLAARACPSVLGLPLLRLDPGRLFGGTVGESEANLRLALQAAERVAPVAIWLDEVDKGLAGLDGGRSDAGTGARVLGSLLTWLAERQHPVFVVATANRVDALPPELLRRGRLDELFFIDLPNAATRRQITRILICDRPARELGQAPPHADPLEAFAELAARAEGYSGAELESALTEARLDALAEERPVAASDFARALHATVPLSITRAEDIEALRQWARGRAREA